MTKIENLQQRATRSRNRLSDLIGELQEQISPGQLLDSVVGFTAEDGAAFGRSIGRQVSRNPFPLLLIAAGVGLYMYSEWNEKTPAPARKRNLRRKRKSAA
jgi:hypothetical protein